MAGSAATGSKKCPLYGRGEVIGPRLAQTGGTEELEAERRESDETIEPL